MKKLVIILMMILFAGCFSKNVKKEYSEKYNGSGIDSISLKNENGDVSIKTWKKDYIDIRYIKSSWNGKKEFENCDVDINLEEELKIKTIYKNTSRKVKVDYAIQIPSSIKLKSIETQNGNINIEKVEGDPVLLSSNGNVVCNGVNGVVSVETSNGDIDIKDVETVNSLISSNGDINIQLKKISPKAMVKTSNGKIDLVLKKDMDIYIRAKTTNGIIKTDIKEIKKMIKGNDLDVKLGKLSNEIYLKTSNGDINFIKLK